MSSFQFGSEIVLETTKFPRITESKRVPMGFACFHLFCFTAVR